MDKKLIQTIKQQLNQRKNIESIKMSLLNSDYSLKQIDEAIKEVKKPKIQKKPLIPSLQSETISSYLPIVSAILLIASSFLYYQTKVNLSNCTNNIGNIQQGTMKFLGITIFEGTRCASLNFKSILFLIAIILTAITTIYLIYEHFKEN